MSCESSRTGTAQNLPAVFHVAVLRHSSERELCLSVSCGGTGQQWPAAGAGALDPQGTPGPSQASLAQFLVGSLLLSPGSWCTQGLVCALQESCPSRTIDRVS